MPDEADTRRHWDGIYGSKDASEVSWFQSEPTLSLELLASAGLAPGASVLDVGGGASVLVDRLLAAGYRVGVLDISEVALQASRSGLGRRSDEVEWFHADVRAFVSPHPWDAWHDRAVFHFLTDPGARAAYRSTLLRTLAPDGVAVIATFGPRGPERCSGLPVIRYGPEELALELGDGFTHLETALEMHRTPQGKRQEFLYASFRRAPERSRPGREA